MDENMTLVICFGNPMRHDDGVALRVADLLARAPEPSDGSPGETVEVKALMQLDVALAEDMAGAARVIFVDAEPAERSTPRDRQTDRPASSSERAAREGEPRVAPLLPEPPAGALRANVHAVTPVDLLTLAEQLYGRAPQALLVAVPAYDFGHGEGLTDEAERAAHRAAAVIRGLLGRTR